MSQTPPQPEKPADDAPAGGGSIRSGKLAGKSMGAAIWILALPVFVQHTMHACVGLADTVFAGRLPEDIVVQALDAISIGSYVTWLIGIAMTGLGIGGAALIGRATGAGNLTESHRALGQAIGLSLLWGVICGVIVWFGVRPLGQLGRLSPEATDMLVTYSRIIACSMPLAALMQVGAMCLHGAGETMRPSLIAVAVNILNVFLSWGLSGVDVAVGDFVFACPISLDLGLNGIAVGTAGSYLIGCLLTIVVLLRGVKDLRLRAPDMRFDGPMSWRIVRIGLPGFFDSLMMWLANVAVLAVIGIIAAGEEGIQSAHFIAIRWESFSFMPGFAIGTAAGTLAAQYLGAGNPRMATRAVVACTGITAILMGSLGFVFMYGGRALTMVISDQPIHLDIVPKLLFICGAVQVFFAVTMVVRQGLRGVGDTKWTAVITTFASWFIRLPAAYVLGVTMDMGLVGIWIALCAEIVLRSFFFVGRFVHGGWKRIEV